jgi:hypothetical protein
MTASKRLSCEFLLPSEDSLFSRVPPPPRPLPFDELRALSLPKRRLRVSAFNLRELWKKTPRRRDAKVYEWKLLNFWLRLRGSGFFAATKPTKSTLIYLDLVGFTLTGPPRRPLAAQPRFSIPCAQPGAQLPISTRNVRARSVSIYSDLVGFGRIEPQSVAQSRFTPAPNSAPRSARVLTSSPCHLVTLPPTHPVFPSTGPIEVL